MQRAKPKVLVVVLAQYASLLYHSHVRLHSGNRSPVDALAAEQGVNKRVHDGDNYSHCQQILGDTHRDVH